MSPSRYDRIIEHIFFSHHREGLTQFTFDREEMVAAAEAVGIKLPKNLGDVIYSYRYRRGLPPRITETAAENMQWIIRPAGVSQYRFVQAAFHTILPNPDLPETKIPDATPGVIKMYSLTDEQALLAVIRYNRLIDIFTQVTCYSLQSHLRTQIPDLGQVETDELYAGVDQSGAHYILPVQAKGGTDRLSVIQIEQDYAVCQSVFPNLIPRPIAAQFMAEDLVALFGFDRNGEDVGVAEERHYRLVQPHDISSDDLQAYRDRD